MNMALNYTYRRNPFQSGAFQIFQRDGGREDKLVGDYILLDHLEDEEMTEKKVINLISILNGTAIIDLSDKTDTRLHYQRLDKASDGRCRVLFRTYRGEENSEENAIFTYQEGIFT